LTTCGGMCSPGVPPSTLHTHTHVPHPSRTASVRPRERSAPQGLPRRPRPRPGARPPARRHLRVRRQGMTRAEPFYHVPRLVRRQPRATLSCACPVYRALYLRPYHQPRAHCRSPRLTCSLVHSLCARSPGPHRAARYVAADGLERECGLRGRVRGRPRDRGDAAPRGTRYVPILSRPLSTLSILT